MTGKYLIDLARLIIMLSISGTELNSKQDLHKKAQLPKAGSS